MLLSRVADALYWISRYLERADHTSRVVDIAVDLGLGRQSGFTAIDRLYGSLGLDGVDAASPAAAERAFFDASNRMSVFACIVAARENARQVREEISTDMWEQLNALFLRLRRMSQDPARSGGRTHYVARAVSEGVHLFQGITDATMGHGEGWQYLQAGRFLERAAAVAGLLDTFLADGPDTDAMAPLDQVEWVALLRACHGLEGYCRQNTADVRRERVAEFLLLNAESPRSVRFAAASLESALLALARYSGRRAGGRAERLAGRLHASLDYAQVDEILAEDPHAYLAGIGGQCVQIHAALYQTYIGYAIELALPA
jgi:uncharacterized alpha-E superfamily protein